MKRYVALGMLCTAILFSVAAAAQDAPADEPEAAAEVEDSEFNLEIDRLSEEVRDAVTAAMREMSKMVETTVEKAETRHVLPQPVELVFAITGVAENMSVVTAREYFELSISRTAPPENVPAGQPVPPQPRMRVPGMDRTFMFGVEGNVEPSDGTGTQFMVRFEGQTQYEVDGTPGKTEMAFQGDLPLELGKTVTIARENDQKVTLTIRNLETE